MEISEKVAYLKGLAEGLALDTESKEGKLIAAIIDVLDDMSGKFEDLEDELCDVEDGLDAVSDDLCEVEEALYELEDENGNKQTFELLDAMEYGDEKYYALTPYYENGDEALEDSGDVVILKAEYDENNDEILASIEDDDEYEKIGQMFMERIDEMFEFDDEDEDEQENEA